MALLKCINGSVLALQKCMNGSVWTLVNGTYGSVWCHLRFPLNLFPLDFDSRRIPVCTRAIMQEKRLNFLFEIKCRIIVINRKKCESLFSFTSLLDIKVSFCLS